MYPPSESEDKQVFFGPSVEARKPMDDTCPAPMLCPKCDAAMRCNEHAIFLFDVVRNWRVMDYDGNKYDFKNSSRVTGKCPMDTYFEICYNLSIFLQNVSCTQLVNQCITVTPTRSTAVG